MLAACTAAPAPVEVAAPKSVEVPRPVEVAKAVEVTAPTPVAATVPVDALACKADGECVASCSQGAVARAWFERMFPGGEACEDGCANKGTEPPRCEGGRCVAWRGGARDPMCTGIAALVAPQRPGPAHRCARDEECRMSCAWGAVNSGWFALADRPDCKDGCAGKGMTVRCDAGRCLALRDGQPDPECTERAIHGRE